MATGDFTIVVKGTGPHHSGTDDAGSSLSFLISNLTQNGARIYDARFAASGYVEENWLDPNGPRATYDSTYNK